MKNLIYTVLGLSLLLFSCSKHEIEYEASISSINPVDYSNSKFNLFDTTRYANGYSYITLTPYTGGISPNEVKIDIHLKTDEGYYFDLQGTFDTVYSLGYYGNNQWDSAVAINANIYYKGYDFVQQIQAIYLRTGVATDPRERTEETTEVILYLEQCISSDYTNDTVCFDFDEIRLHRISAESEIY